MSTTRMTASGKQQFLFRKSQFYLLRLVWQTEFGTTGTATSGDLLPSRRGMRLSNDDTTLYVPFNP